MDLYCASCDAKLPETRPRWIPFYVNGVSYKICKVCSTLSRRTVERLIEGHYKPVHRGESHVN